MSETVYKIVPEALWIDARAKGVFEGAPIDIADGFIHFSTATQAQETAAKHFAGQTDLLLVAVDSAALGPALIYEVSRGGALFPHLYAPLDLAFVLWERPLPLGDDGGSCVSGGHGMISALQPILKRALFLLDPETAHGVSIRALATGLVPPCAASADPRLRQTVAGLTFDTPLGMAAGYDKNAEVPEALLKLGFGFTEIGTVTPKPQAGNDRPRIFRLVEDEAVINRLGFNNEGHDAALQRLTACARSAMIGVNIGANKDATDRIADYVAGIKLFYPVARYFTANVSSPNTPGLRGLQDRNNLAVLLSAVLGERDAQAQATGKRIPVFLKIAPDLTEEGMDDIAAEALAHKLDGLIVSNTTLSREGLRDRRQAGESGGLSGRPLFEKSTAVLARMRKRVGPDMAIIGVGGVGSGETAAEKIRAGADLVQLYSMMVYEGPSLPGRIVSDLSALCARENLTSIRDIRDSRVDYWAARNA